MFPVLRRGMASCVLFTGVLVATRPLAQPASPNRTLTAVPGVKVGHHTLTERPTGCTVILTERGAVGGVDVRGASPGTRETDLLNPMNTVEVVHATVLAGGSAYGLSAADGVMKYLEERRIGFETRAGVVPIVPAAILFDLAVGDNPAIRPDAACGYRAAATASDAPVAEGNTGAGAGATVGKLAGPERMMKGGLGSAAVVLDSGLVVAALAAVNAVGNVVDPATGETIAGARTPDGARLADLATLLRAPDVGVALRRAEHTTIGVVATNARLTKAQVNHLARAAHDGLARAIRPAHTPADGDTIFALATGTWSGEAGLLSISALAADAFAEAVVRGVRLATGLPGYPAARDLTPRR